MKRNEMKKKERSRKGEIKEESEKIIEKAVKTVNPRQKRECRQI